VYKSDFISQEKRDVGFIGAVVCEFGDPADAAMIMRLMSAYKEGRMACIKGQWFMIDGVDVSEFFGTIFFGLMPCKNG
jgi:hypothetical protein